MPEHGWTPAYDGDGQVREGGWVADVTGLLDLKTWPSGMRVIVRKERPHPGAQLRITDADGHRVTAVATNTSRGELADLELRHRRRARCEDRIRVAKDTGLSNLPLHDFTQNQVWCAIVAFALELTAWLQMLALAGDDARRWEPKRLRLGLFSIAARLTEHGRTCRLHLSAHAPWAGPLAEMITRLQTLPRPRPDDQAHRVPTALRGQPVEPDDSQASSGKQSHPDDTITDQRPGTVARMINSRPVNDPG